MLTRERQGELYIFGEIILWSLFPVLTILSYSRLTPLMSVTLATLFSAAFFGIVLLIRQTSIELTYRDSWRDIFLMTLINGFFYYLLYFLALRYTSAGNASIIALSEVLFSFLFFNVWHKERISLIHVVGALCMVIGAIIVLFPRTTAWNNGGLLILLATMIAPFGNFFQQRAREKISPEAIMFFRNLLTAPLFFISSLYFDPALPSIDDLSLALPIILANALLVFTISKILWIESIHRISVTKALALNGLSPLITLFFAWVFLGDLPTIAQLYSFPLLLLGVVLLTQNHTPVVLED